MDAILGHVFVYFNDELKLHIVKENVSIGPAYPDRAKISNFVPYVITANWVRCEPIGSIIVMDIGAEAYSRRRRNLFDVVLRQKIVPPLRRGLHLKEINKLNCKVI